MTTKEEFTNHQQDQANGCALLVHAKKNPDLFSTTTSTKKHQQDHANVNCPECNQLFSAKRNLNRHVKKRHNTVEANISRNSNKSNPDENFNPDAVDIDNVEFLICS